MKKNDKITACIELPLDFDYADSVCETTEEIQSIPDALINSLRTYGRVNMEYILSVTQKSLETIIKALKSAVYQNPETWNECPHEGWETADEYLSGNLMRKLSAAKKASKKFEGMFEENIKAIESVLPPRINYNHIYITLGSPWVPADIIDDFIKHLFGKHMRDYNSLFFGMETKHNISKGKWEIPYKNRFNNTARSTIVTSTYGTSRLNALHILEKTLNHQPIIIRDKDEGSSSESRSKWVVNVAETELAKEKQKKLINEFQSWVWKDKKRKERLEKIYETKFGCIRKRMFDGSFLSFPGMSDEITLYPHQKNAVARIILTPNTLLAHDVGTGKTYIMAAAGMEMRRMGISKKNLYVVPNNVAGQWEKEFRTLYPKADILLIEPRNFSPRIRNSVISKIRDGDYDAVIIAYSCFKEIKPSKQYCVKKLEKKISDAKRNYKAPEEIKKLEDELMNLENRIYFDELGINTLFVDEAHNFKNLPTETGISNIVGFSANGSEKCEAMLEKVRHTQKTNSGRGVVFATGTPITNSIADMFAVQHYLQYNELSFMELQHFNSWIGMFAEMDEAFEIEVDTSKCRMSTRFSKFNNLEELNNLFALIADLNYSDSKRDVPDFDGYTNVTVPATDGLKNYLKDISRRADDVKSHRVLRTEDNMLKITTDGRKAALDLRLVDVNSTFSDISKVYRCAENVFDIFTKTSPQKSTQIIFCDIATPKDSFNIYDELTRILVSMGVPRNTVAYIHDAKNDKERSVLFSKVKSGEIRILIGSTPMLGLGVNVQDKLIALHHLDVPWKPSEMVQREGRILRQGNTNEKVFIFRYITEKSFDSYSWQLLEKKQKFITQILSGELSQRSCDDVDGTVLDYAEVKALAIDDPLIKSRVETSNELERYKALQRGIVSNCERLQLELNSIPESVANNEKVTEEFISDREFYKETCREYEKEERKIIQKKIFNAVQNNSMVPKERTFLKYQGFTVILPANMAKDKPYIILKKSSRHYISFGETEVGTLIRIDNYLNNLDKHIEKLRAYSDKLLEKASRIRAEIDNQESYIDKIDELENELKLIDERLGIKNERN
ncbi:MAG: DEAD/DEAH box helicase family protein [Clostridia bacterium]|nr:DEAD/DEAH box helicase family protein [Clostridia bacterium]